MWYGTLLISDEQDLIYKSEISSVTEKHKKQSDNKFASNSVLRG